MSEYRRFIAYVYEYEEGKKGEGRGFIKVESKDGICKMQYKLSGIHQKKPDYGKVFGYVRKNDFCEGFLLGECNLTEEMIQFEYEMPADSIGGSAYTLEDMCGLVILTDSGIMYGSGWDDNPILLQEILFPEEKTAKPEVTEERVEEEKNCWNGFCDFIKITPENFSVLQPKEQGLLYNQFLRYGFSQKGYLILARRDEDNQFILGVPGRYAKQEALMAQMFGFPYFIKSKEFLEEDPESGYWYRWIEKPNLEQIREE